ncbi:unnamed protein product [Mucor hiemalis]
MSSLANLISSVKANTASNKHLNKSLKRKAPVSKVDSRQVRSKILASKLEQPTKTKVSEPNVVDSRISVADPNNAVEQKNKPTAKDVEEEAENQKHNLELKQLLATSNLLEELERDEMTLRKEGKHNEKVGKFRRQVFTRGEDAVVSKDMGIYDKSLKHLYVKTEVKKRDRNPGITNGIGRMKGATLTIKKSDIERIKRQGSKKKSTGGKKGGKR